MSAKAVADLAAFREARRRYIGGTDVAAIAGFSSWGSPLSVYLDKTAPEKAEDKDSLIMRRGLALERFIADEFTLAHPGLVCYHPRPIVRTDWGFPAGASVDFMVARKERPRTPIGILEAKTAFRDGWRTWNEEQADLPDSYYVQQQWYLAVTELPVSYGAADVGDDRLRVIPLHAATETQERLIAMAREFWQRHVERGVPPEPTGTKSDQQALTHMWPDTIPDPPLVIESLKAAAILKSYIEEREQEKAHKAKADEAKQKICALMGENETAICAGYRLSWKRSTSHLIDTARLREEKPDIAAEYAKESVSRTFAAPKEIA